MSDYKQQIEDAYKERVIKSVEKKVRFLALEAYGQIVQRTPVGDPSTWQSTAPSGYAGGTAKQSWNMDINVSNFEPDPVDESNPLDLASKRAEASSTAAGYKVGDTIHISNGLPYIQRLNDGWSQQAPAGFIQGAVKVATRKTQEYKV